MLLKIFTKRDRGGAYVETHLEWKEWTLEADEIYKREVDGGFEFLCKKGEFSQRVTVFTSIQGYQIENEKGVSVEKYVTPIDSENVSEDFRSKLVSFGNYLLSEERRKYYESHPNPEFIGKIEDRLKSVDDSDLRNWEDLENSKK